MSTQSWSGEALDCRSRSGVRPGRRWCAPGRGVCGRAFGASPRQVWEMSREKGMKRKLASRIPIIRGRVSDVVVQSELVGMRAQPNRFRFILAFVLDECVDGPGGEDVA